VSKLENSETPSRLLLVPVSAITGDAHHHCHYLSAVSASAGDHTPLHCLP